MTYDCVTTTSHRAYTDSGAVLTASEPFLVEHDVTCCEVTDIVRTRDSGDRGVPADALAWPFWTFVRLARWCERMALLSVERRTRRIEGTRPQLTD